MKDKVEFIIRYAKPYKIRFFAIFVAIIISAFTGAFYPYIFGILVDEVFYKKTFRMFFKITMLYGCVFFIDQFVHFIINILWVFLMNSFIVDIRRDLFNKVLSYKANQLSSIYTGDIIFNINKDVDQVLHFIHNNIFFGVSRMLNLAISFIIVFKVNYILALTMILLVPVTVIISKRCAKKIKNSYAKIMKESGLLSSWLFEMIRGMSDIKLMSATQSMISEYITRDIKIERIKIKANKLEVLSERINSGIWLVDQLILFIVSTILISKGYLTLGGFTICISYFRTCVTAFENLNSKVNSIAKDMVSFKRILKVLNEQSEDKEIICDKNGININGNITFQNVFFGYNKVNVLNNLSFHIEAGKTVAIVGESGAGKSTIANLLCRLYDVTDGKILIDGIDLKSIPLYLIRTKLGIVYQDTFTFTETIRYNILFSNDKEKDEEVWEALNKANLSLFVQSLPQKLDTIIGDGNFDMSGGQKQRLVLARIFMKNPTIVILDEATSSLDNIAEQAIKASWEQLNKNRTIIIIAHKLTSVINADHILVLDHGKIVDQGTHNYLLQKSTIYSKLFYDQLKAVRECD